MPLLMGFLLMIPACTEQKENNLTPFRNSESPIIKNNQLEIPDFGIDSALVLKVKPVDGFDYPVGPPNGAGYYKFRGLIPGEHYGEDWNGKGGGNTDFGDLVYVVADGVVFYSNEFRPGWGKVVRVLHNIGTESSPEYIESLYAHLASDWVKVGNKLRRGDPLGTIGSADGIYHAHLHLEMRDLPNMPIPWDEGADTSRYIDPELFIRKNRPNR